MKSGLWKFFFWPLVWSVVFATAAIADSEYGASTIPGSWPLIVGIAILIWALAIHIIAGKTLKKLGHSQASTTIWPDQMVTVGIYSCMRHPEHLGLALMPLGIAFIIGSISALLAAGWAILAGALFVLFVEEPECLDKFGADYYHYMRNTPAISLNINCMLSGWQELKRQTDKH